MRYNDVKLSWNNVCVYIFIYLYTHESDEEDLLSCYQKQNCEGLVLHPENMYTWSFSRSSFEDPEAQQSSGMKIPHPASRVLAASQEAHLQSPDKAKQKDLEPMTLGTTPEAIEIVSPVW